MPEVYADQWKACADLMRAKAVEFDELAKRAPHRPEPVSGREEEWEFALRSARENCASCEGDRTLCTCPIAQLLDEADA